MKYRKKYAGTDAHYQEPQQNRGTMSEHKQDRKTDDFKKITGKNET